MSSLKSGLAPARPDPPSRLRASPATSSALAGSRTAMWPGVCPGVAITCRPNTSSPSPTARQRAGRGDLGDVGLPGVGRRSGCRVQHGREAAHVVRVVVGEDHMAHGVPTDRSGIERALDLVDAPVDAGVDHRRFVPAHEQVGRHESERHAVIRHGGQRVGRRADVGARSPRLRWPATTRWGSVSSAAPARSRPSLRRCRWSYRWSCRRCPNCSSRPPGRARPPRSCPGRDRPGTSGAPLGRCASR